MIAYVAKRLAMAFATIYVVVTLSFFMIRLMPGNAMEYLETQMTLQGGMSPTEIDQRVRAIYGLVPTGPLWQQYFQYVANVFRGNLGQSITNPGEAVTSIIAGALPWTIFVVSIALIISFLLGLIIGTVMAAFKDSWVAKLLTGVASLLAAIPNYIVAIVLLYFLAYQHPIFPLDGAYSVGVNIGLNWAFVSSALDHAFLPICTYVIVAFGSWALAMKGSVTTIMGADYIRAAESWGLSRRRVTQSYIGRNSMLPMVTSLALSVGYMFGGSVFIETYFTYPGIGYYLIGAVDSRDYSLMMGCFMLITVAVVIANLAVDFIYPLVDPRITSPVRAKGGRTGLDEVGSEAGVAPLGDGGSEVFGPPQPAA